MVSLNLDLIEKLLELEYDVEKIEEFKTEYKLIDKDISNYKQLLYPNKICKLNKKRQDILNFIDKYNDMINVFNEKNLLYAMTDGFDLNYHWKDAYKNILIDLKSVKKEKVLSVIKFFKDNNFRNIEYKKDLHKKYYEKCYKRYDEKYEIDYYITDGNKTYLANNYDSYPVIIENAKFIIQYKKNNWFYNGKVIYISTFDIDLDKIKLINNDEEIILNFPFDYVKKLSKICSQIRAFDEQIKQIETTIMLTKELLNFEDLKELSLKQIEDLKTILESTKENREALIEKYASLEYDKKTILMSL